MQRLDGARRPRAHGGDRADDAAVVLREARGVRLQLHQAAGEGRRDVGRGWRHVDARSVLRGRVLDQAPAGPTPSWLGETIVHAEDVRSALGITHAYPVPAVVAVADFYKGSNVLIGAKRRVEGVTLTATDTSWTHGTGPQVSGPVLQLLLAMTGRKAALDALSGDGVATLRGRP